MPFIKFNTPHPPNFHLYYRVIIHFDCKELDKYSNFVKVKRLTANYYEH